MYFSIGYISAESFINFFKGESVGEIRTTEWKVWPANFTMVMTPVIFLASTLTDLPKRSSFKEETSPGPYYFLLYMDIVEYRVGKKPS